MRTGHGVILVERGVHSAEYWATWHPTFSAAAAYHDGHEFPEDWPIVEAVDIATGDARVAQLRTHLVPPD